MHPTKPQPGSQAHRSTARAALWAELVRLRRAPRTPTNARLLREAERAYYAEFKKEGPE